MKDVDRVLERTASAVVVLREVCAGDRRKWSVLLTDEGMAALRAAAPIHVESVRTRLLDQLTPAQVEQLGEIGRALLAHLGTDFDLTGVVAPRGTVRTTRTG